MACQLLGFKPGELQKLTLEDVVIDPERGRSGLEVLAEMEIITNASIDSVSTTNVTSPSGKVLVSGKVVKVSFHSILSPAQAKQITHYLMRFEPN